MAVEVSPFLSSKPFLQDDVLHVPLCYMRGGTSTGVLLWGPHLAPLAEKRELVIRRIMGVPDEGEFAGNTQITGLGRGPATSNKVFVLEPADDKEADFNSTLAQLSSDRSEIDWSVNCGNMSAAIPLFLINTGLTSPSDPLTHIRVFNTNTGVITDCRVRTPGGKPFIPADTVIPGVMGAFPGVELSLRDPVGSKTGHVLPTGRTSDYFDGIEVSCVDVAVPMVIIRSDDMGASTEAQTKEMLRSIWVQAGRAMELKRGGVPMSVGELAASVTVPKVCLVSKPTNGGHISARYFTPQESHASLAVTGGCCLAAACLIPGTVAHQVATGLGSLTTAYAEHLVAMENPAGILRARVSGRQISSGNFEFPSVSYERNAQLFMEGYFRIYRAIN
jgi:2-methylaconitate cis-trans-isomerase PrpF